jgi:hypothetical protein
VQVTPAADSVNVYDARIPIALGESIGLECCAGAPGTFLVAGTDLLADVWDPPLGEAPRPPFLIDQRMSATVNADIEPDLDGDGFGDESQDADDDGDGLPDVNDGCPATAASTPTGCPAPPPPAPRVNTAPTVRFRAPVAAAAVGATQAIDLEVSDDAGAPTVTVHDDDGTICTLTREPYGCLWTPTGADVGRATLLASAVDSDGRSTLGIVRVNVSRFTATLTRRRSGRRVTGTLRLPAAVERSLGCRGTVTVRRGKAKRTTALKRDCTYSVRLPKASGPVRARFGGNAVVVPT